MVVVVMEVEATVVVMEAAAMEEVMVVVTEVVMEVVTEVAKDTEEVATEVAKDTEEAAMEVAATVAAKEVMAEDTEVAAMEEVMEEVTVEVMEEATVAVTEVAMEVVVMEADTTVKHSSIIIFTSNAGHLISNFVDSTRHAASTKAVYSSTSTNKTAMYIVIFSWLIFPSMIVTLESLSTKVLKLEGR
ncbi:uncharacterized protein LOC124129106 [Haliotis rufescens]|uniref:uncharacterized protein LOC124129106 n=1 Tax=Haliotis rufescens TaxID=6454 RepID=UPI00201EFADE|nr:uncharacterized protein LOC124129106 [Haliotis rufescens]